jgi:A/G-specific adenine glycosylase
MLQQTQVSTVIPYYERFLQRFPNPKALAAADEDEVFHLWAGLGYYRRARQLHAASKQIVEKHDGIFPRRLEDVLALPGIGRYTANAILSFAHDDRLGIVEANTQRLYARLLGWEGPIETSKTQRKLWDYADQILPKSKCGEFNQAMMEIGSQVCTPRNPSCDQCPLVAYCPTSQNGQTDRIPAPKPQKIYTDLTEAVVLLRNTSAQWFVRRCGESERWAGLWDFPRFDVTGRNHPDQVAAILQESMQQKYGLDLVVHDLHYSLRHAVTRYRIQLHCFLGVLKTGSNPNESNRNAPGSCRWLALDALHALAWNASGKRILKWVENTDSVDKLEQR